MADDVPSYGAAFLQVLNIAGNKLSGSIRVQGVPKLRALIANDNAITAVKGATKVRQSSHAVLPCCAPSHVTLPWAPHRDHAHVTRFDALTLLCWSCACGPRRAHEPACHLAARACVSCIMRKPYLTVCLQGSASWPSSTPSF